MTLCLCCSLDIRLQLQPRHRHTTAVDDLSMLTAITPVTLLPTILSVLSTTPAGLSSFISKPLAKQNPPHLLVRDEQVVSSQHQVAAPPQLPEDPTATELPDPAHLIWLLDGGLT